MFMNQIAWYDNSVYPLRLSDDAFYCHCSSLVSMSQNRGHISQRSNEPILATIPLDLFISRSFIKLLIDVCLSALFNQAECVNVFIIDSNKFKK